MDERQIEALFAGAAFERELAALTAAVPYTRPGVPGLLLTAEQWANYDELQALADRCERKYGRMFPKTFAGALNSLGRRIW